MSAEGDALRRAFPGSLIVDNSPAERRGMMSSYLTAMWGDRPGVAAFGLGVGPYIGNTGKYSHQHFNQSFYAWPAQREKAITEMQLASNRGETDVYVSPMLRAAPERKKASGAGGRWAWADCDGEMTAERRAIIATLGEHCRLISSGTGHHVYVELDDWKTPDEIEAANRALAAVLDADSKWSNESLLRPPGTWNLKPRTRHLTMPALVQVVYQ